jgi:hypothetical protein
MERREPITLFDDVPALDPESDEDNHVVVETRQFPQDGTIERVWARNYIGHDFDLRYRFRIKNREGRKRNLFRHLGEEFITGDDDERNFDLREPVEAGETLIIEAENDQSDYLYHANCEVVVDYEGGVVGALRAAIDDFLGGVL